MFPHSVLPLETTAGVRRPWLTREGREVEYEVMVDMPAVMCETFGEEKKGSCR